MHEQTINFKSELEDSEPNRAETRLNQVEDRIEELSKMKPKVELFTKEMERCTVELVMLKSQVEELRNKAKKLVSTDNLAESLQELKERLKKDCDVRTIEAEENLNKMIGLLEDKVNSLDRGIKSELDLFDDEPPFTYNSRNLISGYVSNINEVFVTEREKVKGSFEDTKPKVYAVKSINNNLEEDPKNKLGNQRERKFNDIYNKTSHINKSKLINRRFSKKATQ